MAWIYIVKCADGSFYTGSTQDLELRLWQHNHGDVGVGANFTRKRRPVVLVFSEQFDNVVDAFAAEKQIQGWSRAKKLALIEGRVGDLPQLSRSGPSTSSETGPGSCPSTSSGAGTGSAAGPSVGR
ncbi:MAG TPA: GIY-YIG nuclease family protein [Galbitalea sp.]|jgi:putative endonuclease|nr:GIY-YIG nuclease family protein [Galbitalea sp.]